MEKKIPTVSIYIVKEVSCLVAGDRTKRAKNGPSKPLRVTAQALPLRLTDKQYELVEDKPKERAVT